MRPRLLGALCVVALLTGFAPAPFVRVERRRDRDVGDVLAQLQGSWSMDSKVRMGPTGNLSKYAAGYQLSVMKDSWSLVSARQGKAVGLRVSTRYILQIEPNGYPRPFRVKRTSGGRSDYMVGILSVEGDKAKMLYRLASSRLDDDANPKSFDTIPEGWYLMTFTRDK